MAKFADWSGPARKRLYRSLPFAGALMVAYGVIDNSTVSLWVGLAGALIGPISGEVAARHVSDDDRT